MIYKNVSKFTVTLSVIYVLCISTASYGNDELINISSRIFGFIEGMPKKKIYMSIVYDPANTNSNSEAIELHKNFNGGKKLGSINFFSNLVPIDKINKINSADVVYVTKGLSSSYERIFVETTKRNILSFSSDLNCAATKKCVMGVNNKPKVKITISKSVSTAIGLKFAPSLLLLIEEIE